MDEGFKERLANDHFLGFFTWLEHRRENQSMLLMTPKQNSSETVGVVHHIMGGPSTVK